MKPGRKRAQSLDGGAFAEAIQEEKLALMSSTGRINMRRTSFDATANSDVILESPNDLQDRTEQKEEETENTDIVVETSDEHDQPDSVRTTSTPSTATPRSEKQTPRGSTAGSNQDTLQIAASATNLVLETMDGGKWYNCKGGTFAQVAVWMATYNQDKRNLHSFLLCYRQWAPPETLFAIVMALFGYTHAELALPESEDPILEVVSPSKKERLGHFLCEWVEHYFAQDFQRKAIFQHLVAFTKITKSLREEEGKRLKLLFIQKPRATGDAGWLSKPVKQISLVDIKATSLAEQLTFIDAKQFRSIKPEEFLDTAWTKKNKEEIAPNLLAFCHRFNQVSWWVATQIVEAGESKKQRALLVKFITTAERCHTLGNYNSLMAILSGLNNFSIQRLKKAWLLPAKYKDMFDKLEILMEPKQNFKNYRKEISKKSKEDGAHVIPYVAMYLRDITFVYDGNNDFLDEEKKLVNFEKWKLVYDQIGEIKHYQKGLANHTIEQDPALSNFLMEVTYLDEETLHEKSLICEPPRGAVIHDAGATEKEESIFGPDKTITKAPFSWTVANVQEWLDSKDMSQYKELFSKKTINGAQVLELNNRTLLALGINNLVHRKQMLKCIQALQSLDFNNYAAASTSTWQNTNTRDWTTMDVCMWLESNELGEYKKVFLENQVAGAELLDLENDDLLAMNMTRLGHRKRLLMKKQELLLANSSSSNGKPAKRNNSAPANKYSLSDFSDDERSISAPDTPKESKVKRRFSWDHGRKTSLEDSSESGGSDREEQLTNSSSSSKTKKGRRTKRSSSIGDKVQSEGDGLSYSSSASTTKEKRKRSSLLFGKSKSLTASRDAVVEEPDRPLSARDVGRDSSSDDNVSIPEDDSIALKCYLDKAIKLLHVEKDINLSKLKKRIIEEYGLTVSSITLKYKDLEEDRITIRCEDDLRFAMLSIGTASFMKLFVSV